MDLTAWSCFRGCIHRCGVSNGVTQGGCGSPCWIFLSWWGSVLLVQGWQGLVWLCRWCHCLSRTWFQSSWLYAGRRPRPLFSRLRTMQSQRRSYHSIACSFQGFRPLCFHPSSFLRVSIVYPSTASGSSPGWRFPKCRGPSYKFPIFIELLSAGELINSSSYNGQYHRKSNGMKKERLYWQ